MKILRFKEVRERTGLSRTTIWRYEERGLFPKRKSLGQKTIGWLSAEVDDWIKSTPTKNQGGRKDD